MIDAVERLVNLALFFAGSRGPVTSEEVRDAVFGYPSEQDEAAFLRMFERDKDDLRSMGFAIRSDAEGNYRFDRVATYVSAIDLSAADLAALRMAGAAIADDPAFPFGRELRFALAKLSSRLGATETPGPVRLVDESPAEQGQAVAVLTSAAQSRKCVSFAYTDHAGEPSTREVEPYGLFLHDGRWYLVGHDRGRGGLRTFAVYRIANLQTNTTAPKTPDFERPDDFDVATFVGLPFQYGPDDAEFEAVLLFDAAAAWRARALAGGRGALREIDGGRVEWRVPARSRPRLLRFVIGNGPGISVAQPTGLADLQRQLLSQVVTAHV